MNKLLIDDEQFIYYLNKKILRQEYFINYDEYAMFEINMNISKENVELMFNNNLVLSQDQIKQLKNDALPYINDQNNFGTTSRVLHGDLICLERTIDETIIVELNKEILRFYNSFVFRKLGNELLKKHNNNCDYCSSKIYVVDINKDTNEYVFFDSSFQTYICFNNDTYAYHFYWIYDCNSDKNDDNNKIILKSLQKKFPNVKFNIISGYSVNKLYFTPLKKRYIKIFHKIGEYLEIFNIKARKDSLLYLE